MRGGKRHANPWTWALLLLVVCGILLGLYGRFHELGSRQLAIDEYYFVQSVDAIRETSLPGFATGGYYTRGIIHQYLSAASAELFNHEGFAYRLPSAIFGVLAIVLTFFFARRHLGASLALMAALALALSSWNIEFSRFARMYEPLQVITLSFLLSLDISWRDHRRRLHYLPHFIIFIGILIHQQAILLAPLLFLPYLACLGGRSVRNSSSNAASSCQRPGIAYGGISLVFTALVVKLARFDFRNLGVDSRLAEDYIHPASHSMFRLPTFPFFGSENQLLAILVLVALLAVCVLLIIVTMRARTESRWPVLLAGGILIACIFHLYLPAAFITLALVARYRFSHHPRVLYIMLGAAVFIALGWLALALTEKTWIEELRVGSYLDALQITFLGFPDYRPLIHPWKDSLPMFGALLLLGVAGQLIKNRHTPIADLVWNPVLPLIYAALCVSLLYTSYSTTRYMFFLYPLMLVVILATIRDLVEWALPRIDQHWRVVAASIIGSLAFVASEDFHLHHLLNPTAFEINYRTGNYQSLERVWYPRQDFKSAAQFADARVMDEASDRLLVYNTPPASRYISSQHAVYYPSTNDRYTGVSRESGTIDLWSNQQLISTPEGFQNYARRARSLWVVWILESWNTNKNGVDWNELLGNLPYEARLAYVSKDERVRVTEIILNGESSQSDMPDRISEHSKDE